MTSTKSWPNLPIPENTKGEIRRVGVEIEFAGLTEAEVADLLVRELGGRIEQNARMTRQVVDTAIGTVEVELDTALRKGLQGALLQPGLELVRGLIPVEIVTEPLLPESLEKLEGVVAALRDAGAIGSAEGALLGFGVHFNVEIADPVHTARTVQAFGLLEPVFRAINPVERTRRWLPFVDPWPSAFVDALCVGAVTLPLQRANYARHVASRNHGLDLLPLFKDMDAETYGALFPALSDIKGRPAFHFRLPDSRVDEPDWTLAKEWKAWLLVERVAANEALLSRLADEWRIFTKTGDDAGAWVAIAKPILNAEFDL